MNLPALALRWATVFALRGETWAAARVLDQPLNPLKKVEAERMPLIAVYTGDADTKAEGRDWLAGDTSLALVIQVYLPPEIDAPNGLKLQMLGAGGEMALNLMGRQIEAALLKSKSAWAVLWRELIFKIHGAASRPYLIEVPNGGSKYAARELIVDCEPVASPSFGAPDGVWSQLIAQMMATPEVAPFAGLVDAALRSGASQTTWETAITAFGLRDATAAGIGLAPRTVDANGVPVAPTITSINIDGLGPNGVTIDEP